MRKLKYICDKKLHPIFDAADVVALLTETRTERFTYEYAICLFQFLTWMIFPDTRETDYVKSAGPMAAAMFLERLEEQVFVDEDGGRRLKLGEDFPLVYLDDKPDQTVERIRDLRLSNDAYRRIFNRFIAEKGGLLGLLRASPPRDFDSATDARIEQLNLISDLVDYRLRYVQHVRDDNVAVGANQKSCNVFLLVADASRSGH